MGIVSIYTDTAGQVNVNPRRVKIVTTDSLGTVTTAGYLQKEVLSTYTVYPTDIFDIIYSYVQATNSGTYGEFLPTFSNGVITLNQAASSGITLPTIANHIATYTNTAGLLSEDPATAISGGNIQAGLSGTAGYVASFPSAATSGQLQLKAVANSGNFTNIISNASTGQATTWSLQDPGTATANVLQAPAALVSGNLNQSSGTVGLVADSGIAALNVTLTKVFTLTFSQLASAGKVNIQVHSSGTSQYYIQDIKVLTSTGLSGGGGNRLLAVTDGTLVWNNAGITAALLGTPIFTLWSGTGNPIAVSTSQVSTAGADIYFQYTGGTTDYTAGSVQISVTYVKVTA